MKRKIFGSFLLSVLLFLSLFQTSHAIYDPNSETTSNDGEVQIMRLPLNPDEAVSSDGGGVDGVNPDEEVKIQILSEPVSDSDEVLEMAPDQVPEMQTTGIAETAVDLATDASQESSSDLLLYVSLGLNVVLVFLLVVFRKKK